ncbi:hypothetical protein TSUD_343830 [Trifolium subterraneum]|nr:hypothetical protein TSUD_343830 [Trifolium subterraneum]
MQQIIEAGFVSALLNVSTTHHHYEDIKKLALSTISKMTDPDRKAGKLDFSETTGSEDEGSEASESAAKDED